MSRRSGGWRAVDTLEVLGDGGATTDQGVTGGTREPGRAEGMTVPGGAEVAKSQFEANWSTVQGGAEGSEG